MISAFPNGGSIDGKGNAAAVVGVVEGRCEESAGVCEESAVGPQRVGAAETNTAGSAFTELPGVIHRVFNYGTEPVEIIVTAIVPPRYAGYTGTILVNGPRCVEGGE
jgi:hypothetical protein